MATTAYKTIYGTTTGSYPGRRPYVNWRVSSQNITNNTSVVDCVVGSQPLNSTTWGTASLTLTVNGVSRSISLSTPAGASSAAGVQSFTITHASDGSKSIYISLSGGIPGTTGWPGTSLGATVTLPTIPRASTPTLSSTSFDLGSAVTISTNRKSSSFTHTLEIGYSGNSPYRTIATGVGTSYTYTVPLDDASKYPNASSGTYYIRCSTYNGSTYIGRKDVTFTGKVPSSQVPTITSLTVSDASTAFSTLGAYVQNVSKLKPAVTGASGIVGSTIKSYDFRIGTKTVNITSLNSSQLLTVSGASIAVGIKAVDSRGRKSAEVVVSGGIASLAYSAPKIKVAEAVRVTTNAGEVTGASASTPKEYALGTRVGVKTAGSISSLSVSGTQKNKYTVLVKYKKQGGTESANQTHTATTTGTSWTDANYKLMNPAAVAITDAYTYTISISDLFTTVVTEVLVPIAQTALSVGRSGIGAGKVWEKGALDASGDIYVNGFGLTRFDDTRSTDEPPSWYQTNFPRGEYREFKQLSVFGSPRPAGASFGILTTTVPWTYYNAGYQITQKMEISAGGVTWRMWRSATSATEWGSWYGEGENVIIVDGVAYRRSGYLSIPSTPAFTAFGSVYARTVSVTPPDTPAGYQIQYSPHTTTGYTLVGTAGREDIVRIIQIGSNDVTAMTSIRWELIPYGISSV